MHSKLFTLSFLFLTAVGFSQEFTYRLSNVPFKDMEKCHEEAARIADTLSQQAKVKVGNAYCEWDEVIKWLNIIVRYEAEKELSIVSTGSERLSIFAEALYSKLEECTAVKEAQENLFKTQTGLPLLVSHCHGHSVKGRYTLRMEAVGTAQNTPFIDYVYADSPGLDTEKEKLIQSIETYLSKNKAALARIGFQNSFLDHQITWLYYAKNELTLKVEKLNSSSTYSTCQTDLSDVQQALDAKGLNNGLSYCSYHKDPKAPSNLNFLYSPAELSLRPSMEVFKSYAECKASQKELSAKYEKLSGGTYITSVCRRPAGGHNFGLLLFYKK